MDLVKEEILDADKEALQGPQAEERFYEVEEDSHSEEEVLFHILGGGEPYPPCRIPPEKQKNLNR